MPNSKAIVTLTLGAVYQFRWHRFCRENWQAYADRHGYDVICLDSPLDTSSSARPPIWQKCLVLSQPFARQYERIVWVDADILFHPDASCIASQVPVEKVGAVDEYSAPTREAYSLALGRLYQAWDTLQVPYLSCPTPGAFYTQVGLSPFDRVIQAGLLVLSPVHHREILESSYRVTYPAGPAGLSEMAALSHAILSAGCVEWLDPRFNLLFACFLALHAPELLTRPGDMAVRAVVGEALDEAFCLHLAGMGHYLAAGHEHLDRLKSKRLPVPKSETDRRGVPAAMVTTAQRVQSPVAMFLFNRPETTSRVFAAVRRARPSRLFLIADGPRPGQTADAERCAAARAIVEAVDWDCDVAANYAPSNLGLKRRIQSGLDWVFERVEAAIVLEDDCLPGPDFFAFCDDLLVRYRDDERVMSISGNSVLPGARRGDASYHFSRYPLIWGWATWRRAWSLNDPTMRAWPAARDSGRVKSWLGDDTAASYWSYLFQKNFETQDTWDYAWTLTCWLRQGVSVIPAANLVSNIGYGAGATHTRQPDVFADMPLESLTFPLEHPVVVERDDNADQFTEAIRFSGHLRRLMTIARARTRASKRA